MSAARAIAVAAIAAGLLGGWYVDSMSPALQQAPPRQGGGYWILAADFHVHAFAGDGMLAPWALRREAQRQGLDVFALTNHNQTFTARFARWLAGNSPGPIVLVGQEVTARDFHISAVGIERTIDADQPAGTVIDAVHAQGGVAIANHPEARRYTRGYDDRALASLDGFERAHPIINDYPAVAPRFEAFARRVVAVNPGAAFIGSSDFHGGGRPGRCRTYVLARDRTAAAVLEAVRAGRTVAADATGRLYGNAELVRVVEAAGGYQAPPPGGPASAVLAAGVWLGLFALLAISRPAPRRAGR